MKYLIIIEKMNTGYCAYSPDLPGCAATGRTMEETEAAMRDAISFHIEGMSGERLPVPEPSAQAVYVDVAV